jgi:transposase-like protein
MHCPFCDGLNVHKHGRTSIGTPRLRCSVCGRTCTKNRNTLFYRRRIAPQQMEQVLQAHENGHSQREIARLSGLAYNTVVSILRRASKLRLMYPDTREIWLLRNAHSRGHRVPKTVLKVMTWHRMLEKRFGDRPPIQL